jgi:hypothetical protein
VPLVKLHVYCRARDLNDMSYIFCHSLLVET